MVIKMQAVLYDSRITHREHVDCQANKFFLEKIGPETRNKHFVGDSEPTMKKSIKLLPSMIDGELLQRRNSSITHKPKRIKTDSSKIIQWFTNC